MRRWIWTDFLDCIQVCSARAAFSQEPIGDRSCGGIADPTRSHFDAQDFMESGTPGLKATEDGWLNRAIESVPEEEASPFRAVAMGPNLPRMLRGGAPAIALPT